MNSRERIFTILEHKKADRVPITNRFTPEIASALKKILNITSKDSFDLEVELGHDLLCTREIGFVSGFRLEANKKIGDNLYIDDFGVVKKIVRYNGGEYLEVIERPLEDLNNFNSYKFPDPIRQQTMVKDYVDFKKGIEKYGRTHVIVGGVVSTILESCQNLRGYTNFFMDLIINKDFVNELMDHLMEYHYQVGKKLIELGVDILSIGDDVGQQNGTMVFSLDLWREFLKPRYNNLFKRWEKINKDIIFAMHSDGYIEPIIPEMIEIGLDIMNPIQPNCGMDDKILKQKYGNKISFWGGINIQETIPFGSTSDVINEVRDKINIFGKNGGYIISSSHNIQPQGRAIDNTITYYWACSKYGYY